MTTFLWLAVILAGSVLLAVPISIFIDKASDYLVKRFVK